MIRLYIYLTLCIFLIVGCSSTTESYKETFKAALFPNKDVEISFEELHQRSVPVMYLRPDDRGRAALILVSQKGHILSWRSADDRIVQTEQGRISKLQGFKPNLNFVQFETTDPLSLPLNQIQVGLKARSTNDWSSSQLNSYLVEHEIIERTVTKVTFFNQSIPVILIKERVEFPDGSEHVNEYWFDEVSHEILVSKQRPSHFSNIFELIEISKIARLPYFSEPPGHNND